jgi:hypothetical protein
LVLNQILRFLLLILFQVFILDNVELNSLINPYVYPLFILLLPVDIPKWALLVLAFLTGLSIDYFSGVIGIHSAATVFMAFCRPGVLNLVGMKEEIEPSLEPNSKNFSFIWFFAYGSILIFMHHFVLFFLEVFRFSEMGHTLLRILISSLSSIFLIIIIQFLIVRRN